MTRKKESASIQKDGSARLSSAENCAVRNGGEAGKFWLRPDDIMLDEVVVKPKREKYSRKNNPAVELMKKVIAHKRIIS